jgi:hypothetical protein
MRTSHTNCSSKVLHEGFCFLDFGGVDLTANDGAEGNLCPEFLRNSERQGGLSSSWATRKKNSSPGHFLRFDQIHNDTASLQKNAH